MKDFLLKYFCTYQYNWLILLLLIFGCLILGIMFFRRKYRKNRFRIGLAIVLLLIFIPFCAFFPLIYIDGWLDGKYELYSPRQEECKAGGAIMLPFVFKNNLPPDYYYCGRFTQEYVMNLGRLYLAEDDYNQLMVHVMANRLPYDQLACGDYPGPHYFSYPYYGDFFHIYVNCEAGFIVVWGVGADLNRDLNQNVLDRVANTGDFSLLKKYEDKYAEDFLGCLPFYKGDRFEVFKFSEMKRTPENFKIHNSEYHYHDYYGFID